VAHDISTDAPDAPDAAVCRCDRFEHPLVVLNPPALDALSYRVAEYAAFRHALLRPLPGEAELAAWRPSAQGDLAVQILEWTAYLADIITFYNERAANEAYLRTAVLPESVDRLVRLLGYRARPGIGAVGVVAAISRKAMDPLAITAPAGISSTPGPGVPPQTFEAAAQQFAGPSQLPVTLDPDPALLQNMSVLLKGKVTGIRPGERLLLVERDWSVGDDTWSVVTVVSSDQEADPAGGFNTRVVLSTGTASDSTSAAALYVLGLEKEFESSFGFYWSATPSAPPEGHTAPSAAATSYRLLRSTSQASLWANPAPATKVLTDSTAHLSAAVRSISSGDIILFDAGSFGAVPAVVTAYAENIWFARLHATDDPTKPPPAAAPGSVADPTIPVPHSVLTVQTPPSSPLSSLSGALSSVTVRGAWRDVGRLIGTPVSTLSALPAVVSVPVTPGVPQAGGTRAILEDVDGNGTLVEATSAGTGRVLLSAPAGTSGTLAPALKAPLRLLVDLLDVTRGKTVASEVLGSGDPTVPNQAFVLHKSPLTYFAAGDGYTSTLTVWVAGIRWKEVESFYEQRAGAAVYVTRERPDGTTEVRFGDGINGARLPKGVENVVARYRFGSGGARPPARALTTTLNPQPNLASVRNPVAVWGGSDPEPASQVRRYAPHSVLTFGRAVSGMDYETIAATAPGVARARAYWTWDPDEQRTLVKVYVGDDAAARTSAVAALAGAADPNRVVVVAQATAVNLAIAVTLVVDADRVAADVAAAARMSMVDPDEGLFSPRHRRIGAGLYRSQLEAALLVDGALAVHGLRVSNATTGQVFADPTRLVPGEGSFHLLEDAELTIDAEDAGG